METSNTLHRDVQGLPREAGPLSSYNGDIPPCPDWFTKAIATGYETRFVRVKGARVHYQSWSSPNKPGLLLVHGNGAHAHWWDFIAPYFAQTYNVVAMTFSGMGESDWRSEYDMATFAEEQIAVCEATGMFDHEQKPIIVAHSFGGFVTILTGAEYGERLAGTVIVDSPVNPPHRERKESRAIRSHKIYPDLPTALGRFRLAPAQPCENHFAMDYIARWSLKQVETDSGMGWTWRFDPDIWQRFEIGKSASELLKQTACRIALFRGEDSELMPDEVKDYMEQLLDRKVPFVSIPHAYHHVMLDQPLAFVSALRAILADWDHSAPSRKSE
ncbi:alpha/beta fold hydrolase [Ponticaulis profundi]|uniref:Alpha/beta fold hydrolase n=1 Tax=Ponticaulis profundi TaxID=2665222 RepID=A0ABW1SAE0_9PROT